MDPDIAVMNYELTEKQQKLYDFIVSYHRRVGTPPAIREMCEHMGFSSTNSAVCMLDLLIKKGAIERLDGIRIRSFVATSTDIKVEFDYGGVVNIGSDRHSLVLSKKQACELYIKLKRALTT